MAANPFLNPNTTQQHIASANVIPTAHLVKNGSKEKRNHTSRFCFLSSKFEVIRDRNSPRRHKTDIAGLDMQMVILPDVVQRLQGSVPLY